MTGEPEFAFRVGLWDWVVKRVGSHSSCASLMEKRPLPPSGTLYRFLDSVKAKVCVGPGCAPRREPFVEHPFPYTPPYQATHFMVRPSPRPIYKYYEPITHASQTSINGIQVGYHVKTYTTEALQALSRGDHLAVHTWSHSHMTTRSDHDILGELGWTMQIISDLSDGRTLPKYWRPPFGDVDDRVRAIATVSLSPLLFPIFISLSTS